MKSFSQGVRQVKKNMMENEMFVMMIMMTTTIDNKVTTFLII
jgi:hypothetical protein